MSKFLTVIDKKSMYSIAIDDIRQIEYDKSLLMISIFFKSNNSNQEYFFRTEEQFKEMSDHILKTLTEQ